MTETTTTRTINLEQLGDELGTRDLSMAGNGTERTIECHDDTVTQARLEAAVKAHVAIDKDGNRATLADRAQAALDTNRAFLAIASPTNAQILAQVKALTRENTAIIRLLLGLLDGTD